MSDKVRAWVWELDLPPARKLVMLWLAGRATDNFVAFSGEREMRDKTGHRERLISYYLQGLTADERNRPAQIQVLHLSASSGQFTPAATRAMAISCDYDCWRIVMAKRQRHTRVLQSARMRCE